LRVLTKLLTIEPEVSEEKLTHIYLKTIYETTHIIGLSWLGVSVGRHRAGKSIGTISASTVLDKTFIDFFEKRVVYYPKDFLRAMRDIRRREIIGGVVVWDEAGVGLPARDWYDVSNKAVNYALQVAGYLRPIIFFVTQDFTYIDSQARKLIQHFWEFSRSTTNFSFVKPYLLKHNRKTGEIQFIYPRIVLRWGNEYGPKYILTRIRLYRPPQELIERYVIHSEPWKDKIMKKAEEKAKEFEEGDLEKKEWTVSQIIDYLVKNWRAYQSSRSRPDRPRLDPYLIKADFSIPLNLARAIKSRVENILWEEIRKGNPLPEGEKHPYDKR